MTDARLLWLAGGAVLALAACSDDSPGARAAEDAEVTDATVADVGPEGADTADDGATPDADPGADTDVDTPAPDPVQLRVATFNASLFRDAPGALAADLAAGDPQALRVVETLQRVRPDVVLINEFDRDETAAEAFIALLAEPVGDDPGLAGLVSVLPASNTGVPSGVDLDGNGTVADEPGTADWGGDAFGFGTFEGQYGLLVLSRYPIDTDAIRTFRTLRWADMPDALLPADWYSAEAVEVLRLSSKNHVDVPIDVAGHTLHVLASHPTPPSFDGDEDRNGRRNHDEIRFWVDYLTGADRAAWITDDDGVAGGLDADATFVVLGDLNSDPVDGDSRHRAIRDLLAHPRVIDPVPTSDGAAEATLRDGGANQGHDGDPALDTADFSDGRVGNLRLDYALPSSNTRVDDAGVFWPTADSPDADLDAASDHHLVWVDLTLGAPDES